MSVFRQMKTVMNNQGCLTKALQKQFDEVESHPAPQNLYGYEGDVRSQQAEVIVRREHVGSASNDIGFRKVNGCFEAIISEFDSLRYNQKWLEGLAKDYQEVKARQVMSDEEVDFEDREVLPNGAIRLRFRVAA